MKSTDNRQVAASQSYNLLCNTLPVVTVIERHVRSLIKTSVTLNNVIFTSFPSSRHDAVVFMILITPGLCPRHRFNPTVRVPSIVHHHIQPPQLELRTVIQVPAWHPRLMPQVPAWHSRLMPQVPAWHPRSMPVTVPRTTAYGEGTRDMIEW